MKIFLEQWDRDYKAALNKIPLFDPNQTKQWTQAQRQLFIQLFYHQRGHFDDILWFMGNFAPDAKSKAAILGNIQEEFGNHAPSHEALYFNFAKSHGVDLTYEALDQTMYLPFLQDFNRGILRWLTDHDWDHRITAFAAIERLDNLDYPALKEVAVSFGTTSRNLIFFNVHVHSTHYNNIAKLEFESLWRTIPEIFFTAFKFVADHQLATWKKISDFVFNNRSISSR